MPCHAMPQLLVPGYIYLYLYSVLCTYSRYYIPGGVSATSSHKAATGATAKKFGAALGERRHSTAEEARVYRSRVEKSRVE